MCGGPRLATPRRLPRCTSRPGARPIARPDAILDSLSVAERERTWATWIEKGGEHAVFVLDDGAQIVGFASAGRAAAPEAFELFAIYLLASQQRRGGGRARSLRRSARTHAPTAGARSLCASVGVCIRGGAAELTVPERQIVTRSRTA